MRNGHPCPKCGGTDVVRCQAKGLGRYDEIPVGIFGGAQMNRWVCCTCGYCELWMDPAGGDQKDLGRADRRTGGQLLKTERQELWN